jgi:hypothetical protein
MEKYTKHFSWINKLAPYKLQYTCDDDCKMSGCPSHEAEFELYHVTDTYVIKFHNQEIHLDGVQFSMLLDFAERLNK